MTTGPAGLAIDHRRRPGRSERLDQHRNARMARDRALLKSLIDLKR